MDTIIVGAGIIGASIAWRLAQAGASVTLVDAGGLGGESSWAGAGMLAPGGESARTPAWTKLALDSLSLWPDFVAGLEQDGGVSIDYRRCGGLDLARDEEEWARLKIRAATQRPLGVTVEQFEGADLKEAVPDLARNLIGALHYPGDAVVNPRDVLNALRGALKSRNVRLREFQPVAACETTDDGVLVRLVNDAQPIRAQAAVLAAGAWTSHISVFAGGRQVLLPEVLPIKGHLAGYDLAPGSLGPVRRHGHTYVLQRNNGFTIVGSNEERAGFDRNVRPEIIADLLHRGRTLLPMLESFVPSDTWIGFRPATPSLEPELRRAGTDPIWLAYGHYRTGILMAPLSAELIAREILG
jgi:glycine oxidase